MTPGLTIRSLFSFNSIFPFKGSYRGASLPLFTAWLLFFYTVFSGALRKWVLGPGPGGNILFSIQLLAPFIFFFLISFSKTPNRFRIPVFFVFFVGYLLLAALNPMNHTIYHGLFGLLIHLGAWVALISYYQRRDYFELEKLVGFFIVVLIVEVALASVQYSLPIEHILNVKSDGLANDALVGTAVRVSGTFSYIGGFQVMVPFYAFLTWFLLVLEFPFAVTLSIVALSIYAALMSGSRSSLFMFLFVSGFAFIQTGFLFRRFIHAAFTLAILLSLLLYFGEDATRAFDQAYNNFSNRLEWGQRSGEADARIQDYIDEVVNFRGNYPFYGIGLGSTYQGANILYGESIYAKEYGYYESELVRIVLEGGFILFFLRIIVLFVFLAYSYIPLSGKGIIFIFFMGNMVIFNIYQGIFFVFGLILVDRAYYLKAQGGARSLLNVRKFGI